MAANPFAIAEAEQLVLALKSHTGSPADQANLVQRLDKLRCLVHSPLDAMLFQARPFQILPALNLLMDFGVFDAVPFPEGSISVEDLAVKVKLNATILTRFIHILITQGLFREISPGGVYEHTPASAFFRNDQAAALFRLGTAQFPQWWKVSEYLQTHSAEQAQNATTVPYVWALGKEGLTYYEALETTPAAFEAWQKGLMMLEGTRPVTGMFPFSAVKSEVEAEPHRPFVVDVGGGRGTALLAILTECGGSYGAAMVLQDLGDVLEGQDPVRIEGVMNQVYNFYDEQPVKNAHVYYLRNVLHNHYDGVGKKILRRVVDAMGPTSRILIAEMILPDTTTAGDNPLPFFMDVNMFMEGGVERTEQHWKKLLGEAGLEIQKVWRLDQDPVQCTIEAKLKA
ncbi:O-methyltransferase [Cladorrhinum sp. PSN332]|nr:O-methyltransferase [Cladorrhinum sp. PSN332]